MLANKQQAHTYCSLQIPHPLPTLQIRFKSQIRTRVIVQNVRLQSEGLSCEGSRHVIITPKHAKSSIFVYVVKQLGQ